MMRRKINYQQPEYIQNNDLICFGLSSHDVEEWLQNWTPKAEKDLAIVKYYPIHLLLLKIAQKLVQER